MSPEGWGAVAGIVASVCALLGLVVQNRSTTRRLDATQELAGAAKTSADDAKTSADAAAANAEPVSNGFTRKVLEALASLQEGQVAQQAATSQLQTGQDAQGQQIAELHHRTGRMEAAITGHLQAHATADLQRPRSPIG